MLLPSRVEAFGPFPTKHPPDDHPTIDGRVLGNLPRGRFKCSFENLHACALISFNFRFFLSDGINAAYKGEPAAWHNSFSNGRLGRADRVVQRFLFRLHFSFGGCPDPDHRDAACELGEALLQLLSIIIARRYFDFMPNMGAAAVDLFTPAFRDADDRRVVLVNYHAFGMAKLLNSHVFELQDRLLGAARALGRAFSGLDRNQVYRVSTLYF